MHITPEIHVVVDYQNSLTGTNTPSGPGGESTAETSVAAVELFVAGGRRVIMAGETIVYGLSN